MMSHDFKSNSSFDTKNNSPHNRLIFHFYFLHPAGFHFLIIAKMNYKLMYYISKIEIKLVKISTNYFIW